MVPTSAIKLDLGDQKMGMNISRCGKKSQAMSFHTLDRWNDHYKASKSTNKLVLIDFHATWCPPCRYIAPIFKELAAQYGDVEFVKIDVDELKVVAEEFGVTAMPTFVFVKKGQILDKLVAADEDELKKKIQEYRNK